MDLGAFVFWFFTRTLDCQVIEALKINEKRDVILVILAGIFLAGHGFAFFRSVDSRGAGLTLIWAYSFFIITTSTLDAGKWVFENKIAGKTQKNVFDKILLKTIATSILAIFLMVVGLFISSPLEWGNDLNWGSFYGVSWAALSGGFYGFRAFFIKIMNDKKVYEGREETILLPEQVVAVITGVILLMISMMLVGTEFYEFMRLDFGDISNLTILLRVLFLGVISTASPHLLLYKGVGAAKNSSTASVILTLEVIIGMAYLQIFNIRFAGEGQYIGAIFIILAIMVKSGFIKEKIDSLKTFSLTKKDIAFQTMDWSTPQDFFNELKKEFNFTLDPCATHENHKCDKYFTLEDNGLHQDWSGNTVFMNPPYGNETGKWVEKAFKESKKGSTVVCIIAATTEASYWHDLIIPYATQIRFIRGKLEFDSVSDDTPSIHAVVVFDKNIA